jgi:origin recognition complex subunit 5
LQSSKDSVVDGNGHDTDTYERLQYAIVRSAECITGRHLLETAISATADAVGWKGNVNRCENLAQLAVGISRLLEGRIQSDPDGLDYPNGAKFVLVFDAIDRQRDAPPTLLPALARLAETVS